MQGCPLGSLLVFNFPPNKSNINQVELVRISKSLEQMIGERLPLKSPLSVETLTKLLDFEPKMLAQHCGFASLLLLMMCCLAYSIP